MTQTLNDFSFDIKTKDFQSLNKRLLLQPLSIRVQPTADGCRVTPKDKDALKYIVRHLAETVQETLIRQAVERTFSKRGAHPQWASERLLPRLCLSDMDFPWFGALLDDLSKHAVDAIHDGGALKLDAYTHFGSQAIQKQIQLYASELEELTFYGVIEKTLSAMGDDSPSHVVPDSEHIELVGTPNNMTFFANDNEIINTQDISAGIADIYAGEVYQPESERIKEAQFYTYTLLMMGRWGAQRWVVPETIMQRLDIYRERLDIPVIVETMIPHDTAL